MHVFWDCLHLWSGKLVGSLFQEFWTNIFMVISFARCCQLLAYWSNSATDEFCLTGTVDKHPCISISLGAVCIYRFSTALTTPVPWTYSLCTFGYLSYPQSIWLLKLCFIGYNVGALVTILSCIWTDSKLMRKIWILLVDSLALTDYVR